MIQSPKTAFTLIELLVVVTIIVVLLALLVPAMDRAIDTAERAVCAANLHGWYNATAQYMFQHRRKLFAPAMLYPYNNANGADVDGMPYPNTAWVFDEPGHTGQWSLELLADYIPGSRYGDVGGLWHCPSNQIPADNRSARNNEVSQGPKGSAAAAQQAAIAAAWGGAWIFSDYAYFGRVDLYRIRNRAPWDHELVAKTLDPGRILMGDAIYRNQGEGGRWRYNHGAYQLHGEPDIAGINELVGDGAAAWVGSGRFNGYAMQNPIAPGENEPTHFVSHNGQLDGDLNYYARWK